MRLPDAASLPDVPVHVLVRDFPEALAPLRRVGVDVARAGAETLAAAAGPQAAALYEALRDACAWRESATGRPCR